MTSMSQEEARAVLTELNEKHIGHFEDRLTSFEMDSAIADLAIRQFSPAADAVWEDVISQRDFAAAAGLIAAAHLLRQEVRSLVADLHLLAKRDEAIEVLGEEEADTIRFGKGFRGAA